MHVIILGMSTPFKLRSGNTTSFKRMGGSPVKQVDDKKETVEEYNAMVNAEYDTKMQAHSDSTAAYKQAVEVDRAYADIYAPGLRVGGVDKLSKANDLDQEMKKNPIHPTTKRRGKVIPAGLGGSNLIFNNTASDVKPGPPPEKPVMKIPSLGKEST